MSRTLLMLTGISVFITGCGSNTATAPTPAPSPTEAFAISGRVVDYRTGAPLSSANVVILFQFPESLRTTTDLEGHYTLTVPKAGIYEISVNGRNAGSLYVTGLALRWDLFIDTGSCVSRYGLIIDSKTLRPIRGANVTIGPGTNIGACATSGADGWYRCDLGCPYAGINTTVFVVSHPDYRNWSQVVGRGIGLVVRTDVTLEHQ